MQSVNSTYLSLSSANAPKQVRAVIAGTTYREGNIVSAKTSASLMAEAATVGNCVAKRLDLVLYNPGDIPRMATIEMSYRLSDGTTTSSWVSKGTYFIDTRSADGDLLTIEAYDAMLKTEQDFLTYGNVGSWPRTDISVVNTIASAIGVSLDSRTAEILTKGYAVQFPGVGDGAYTMREVLGFVGSMYAGNWIITDQNTLRLVGLGRVRIPAYLGTENNEAILIGGALILA